jgi:hypothetical protein
VPPEDIVGPTSAKFFNGVACNRERAETRHPAFSTWKMSGGYEFHGGDVNGVEPLELPECGTRAGVTENKGQL